MALPTDSAERKTYPVYTGFVRYFPDAIARVAKLSYDGNQKHNPGQPVHWAKEKSTDHRDCEMRHLLDATRLEEEGFGLGPEVEEELTCKAWRALADLQTFFDRKKETEAIRPNYNRNHPDVYVKAAALAQRTSLHGGHTSTLDGDVAGPQPKPVDHCTFAFLPNQ